MSKYICNNCNKECDFDNDANKICPTCKGRDFSNIEDVNVDKIIDSLLGEINTLNVDSIVNKIDLNNKLVIIDENNPSINRIEKKCINCGQCKKTCEREVNIKYNLNECKYPICIGCGQCILRCPTGALTPKYSYNDVLEIINKNEKIVIALISPAVKVSMGENFNMEYGINVEEKIVTALKKIGFDYVFDTSFGADLTIMEEVTEFIMRLKDNKNLPMFSSCCPAWVKYAEIYHPELIDNLSTCKSPIGMQCAIIKSYFAEKINVDPSKIVTVAITPCTAKKMEAKEYTLNIDYVITANELSLLLKEENIKLELLNETNYDSLLGESSGGGVIFGASGGVTESMIRTLYRILTKKNIKEEDINFNDIRGIKGIKELSINICGYKLNIAIVQKMENVEKLLSNNYKKYQFIEVMNCEGGCSGGGGQPLPLVKDLAKNTESRINGLYEIDKNKKNRFAHENKEIKLLYKNYLKKPLSEKSRNLLHTSYVDKSFLLKK